MLLHKRYRIPPIYIYILYVIWLLSGAQGTQRLARAAPLAIAMTMLLQGNPLGAEAAKKNSIIDVVAKKDVVEAPRALRTAWLRPKQSNSYHFILTTADLRD